MTAFPAALARLLAPWRLSAKAALITRSIQISASSAAPAQQAALYRPSLLRNNHQGEAGRNPAGQALLAYREGPALIL